MAVHRYISPPTAAITGLSDQSIHNYGISVTAAFTRAFWLGVIALAALALTACFWLSLPPREQSAAPAAM
ncbi:MAG: hypothetical protein QOI29_2936 [Mycobacterium sp.]|nr:hypothetical protein [Mycobacterium sp.]